VGALRTRDVNGRAIVASFAPVSDTGWGIITEESWEGLIRSSQGYRRSLLVLLALGVVLPSVAIVIGVRRITHPIAALTSAAQELAGGNFDQTITATTGDELEELAEQFNRMAAELQESYQDLERKVADRTKELAAVNAIAASVNESLDLDETLNRALDELLELLDLEVGEIRLLDRARNELVIRTQRGLSSAFVRQTDRQGVQEAPPGRVLLSGQSIICEDVLRDPAESWARQEGLRSLVICPLQAKDRQLGTLSLGTRRGPRSFSLNERELLRAVSDQVGVAIENAQLFQVEQRRAEQLQVINEVGQRIASILSVDELVDEIVHLVKKTLGYYLVGIGLIEDDEIVIKSGAGRFWELRDFQPVRLRIGEEGIVGQVARHGEPILVPDVEQEPRYYYMPEAAETRSELVRPGRPKRAPERL
jgi:GAF domain-containing protein/HAMP domain-containing protein